MTANNNNNKIASGHPLQWPPLIYSTTQREARHWGRTKRGSGQLFLLRSCPCPMSGELKATLPFLLRTQKRLGPAKVFLSQYLGKRFWAASEKEVRGGRRGGGQGPPGWAMALSIFSRPWASSRDDRALGNGAGLLGVPTQRETMYTWDSRVRRLGELKSPTCKCQWMIREKKKESE